jgi:ubiquinone/menaquinone biosynthesis C-methylase UbiE
MNNANANGAAAPAYAQKPDDRSFKARDASSYDSVVDEFDRFTQLLTSPLARRMVHLAQPVSGDRTLDVGTGTGIVALEAARRAATGGRVVGRRAPPGGRVVGIDLSEEMLKTATVKAERAGLAGIVEFRKMDAEALALEDRSFDVVVSLFALLHFPNPLIALQEMFRVLRPGGRLVVAIGSGAPLFSLKGLLHRVRRLPEMLAGLRGRQVTAPGFLNVLVERHFPEAHDPEETALAKHGSGRAGAVVPLVRGAGFEVVSTHWQGHRVGFDDPDEYWDIQRTFSSVARKRLTDGDPEKVSALKQEFLGTCHGVQSRGGKLVYPIAAFFLVCRRPLGR